MSNEWRRAARVAGLLGCTLIWSACGGQGGSQIVGEPSPVASVAGAGGTTDNAGSAGGSAGASDASGGAGSSNGSGGASNGTGGPSCQPGAPCDGINTCVDQCYGKRCCQLACWCNGMSGGQLECSMTCG